MVRTQKTSFRLDINTGRGDEMHPMFKLPNLMFTNVALNYIIIIIGTGIVVLVCSPTPVTGTSDNHNYCYQRHIDCLLGVV